MTPRWRRDGAKDGVEHLRRRAQMTDSKSSITHLPLPGDDPKQRRPDITKAREILGWEPKIPLEVTRRPEASPARRWRQLVLFPRRTDW